MEMERHRTAKAVEAGQWATPEDVNIEKPSNYQGGQVRLRLVQDGDGSQSSGGKVILSDKVLEFSEKGGYNVGRIVGKKEFPKEHCISMKCSLMETIKFYISIN